MADSQHAHATPAPEDIPAAEMYYDEPFFSSHQTALLLGGMGAGFLLLLAILFVVAG